MKSNFNFAQFFRLAVTSGASPLAQPEVPPETTGGTALSVVAVEPRLRLSELEPGRLGHVVRVDAHDSQGRRLCDLGLLPETKIRVVRRAPLGDPTEFELRGYRLCLRRRDAELVWVRPMNARAESRSPAGART